MTSERLVIVCVAAALAGGVSGVMSRPAPATPIGDAHRVISARYRPLADGYRQAQVIRCRRVGRALVDCLLRLTDPVLTCQPGTLLIVPAGLGPCESPPPSTTVRVRVHRGNVWRLP